MSTIIGLSALLPFVYVLRVCRFSFRVNLILLCCYFISTTWVVSQSVGMLPLPFFALPPRYDWILATYPVTRTIFPLFGFSLSIVWALWVRQSKAAPETNLVA
jgi:uncharacterized membrane protein YqaE (UPF0057 family)